MFGKKDSSKSPRYTNGPVVKTGPTAGSNRSRNTDGAWRKKRSDAGGQKKKTGCFLSTCACKYVGLPDNCNELKTLRWFRDNYLLSSNEGEALVEHYYQIAPDICKRLTTADLQYVWDVVKKSVAAIQNGDYELAKNEYCLMVAMLEIRLCDDSIMPTSR